MGEDFATGYAIGQNDSKNNGFGFGGDWWGIIILALLFGWGGGGYGFGGFGGGAGLQGMATSADINEGFALNNLTSGISAIQSGICDSTYAVTNAVNNGFNSVSRQLADCCCENRAAIAQVRYDMANQTRDVIEAGNSNTRAILDFLTQDKISTLTAENQSLKFAASQAAQNNYLAALSDAQTAELIRRISPTPVPAYTVPAPYPYGYGAYNGGCGCAA